MYEAETALETRKTSSTGGHKGFWQFPETPGQDATKDELRAA